MNIKLYKEKVIDDINQVSWMKGKRRIVETSVDTPTNEERRISYSDVMYDVDYITWKVAKVRITNDAEAQYDASTDKSNQRWFNRQYKVAVEHLRDILRPFLSLNTPVCDSADNIFTFRFPQSWQGSISALMGYAHHYVVDFILYEWFRMTMPNEASAYLESSVGWEKSLLEEAHSEYENTAWVDLNYETALSHVIDKLRWCAHRERFLEFSGVYASNDEDWALNTTTVPTLTDEYKVVFDPYSKMFCVVKFGNSLPVQSATFYSNFPQADLYREGQFFISNDTRYVKQGGSLVKDTLTDALSFTFSPEWKGNFESLGNYIHRYIVDFILYEWFKITLPTAAAVYLTSAEQWKDKIINEARSEDVRGVYFRL